MYNIGGLNFRVVGEKLVDAIGELSGFDQFISTVGETAFDFCEGVNSPCPKKELYRLEHEGVTTMFYATDSGYLLEEYHENGDYIKLWHNSGENTVNLKGDYVPQLLRFALWVGYGLLTIQKRILFHGSCIVKDNRAYLFLGESGTGKSTHTRLWRENIEDASLLNDDSPIIAVDNSGIWVYGSPWSGKTPCYHNKRFPLCGIVRLSQAPYNKIERLNKFRSYAAIHPSCPPLFAYDSTLYDYISCMLGEILKIVPVYRMACLPDKDAAMLSFSILSQESL